MLNVGGRQFEGPFSLDEWKRPEGSGIYAILTGTGLLIAQDELLYIGISRNLYDSRIGKYHDSYRSWLEHSEPHGNLLVAHYLMSHVSELQLALAEEKLVKQLSPVCNQLHSPVMRSLFR